MSPNKASETMLRLRLGKTPAEFFSCRGNTRLKRIWLQNNLDEEMIFSSWIGPSKALLKQNVSDYLQAFLIRRAAFAPLFNNLGMFSLMRRLSAMPPQQLVDKVDTDEKKDLYPYFNRLMRSRLEKNYEKREKVEVARVESSIRKGEMDVIPGFQYVVEDPVFQVKEIEKRMKKLSTIPVPYNEQQFEHEILPILTRMAIAAEERREKCHSKIYCGRHKSKSKRKTFKREPIQEIQMCIQKLDKLENKKSPSPTRSSSGFSDISSPGEISSGRDVSEETELIQVFSKMDLSSQKSKIKYSADFSLKGNNDSFSVVAPTASATGINDSRDKEENLDILEETFITDICDICGGLLELILQNDNGPIEEFDNLLCSCTSSKSVWDAKNDCQTATSLYVESAKIVSLYARQHLVCEEYMEQFGVGLKTWSESE